MVFRCWWVVGRFLGCRELLLTLCIYVFCWKYLRLVPHGCIGIEIRWLVLRESSRRWYCHRYRIDIWILQGWMTLWFLYRHEVVASVQARRVPLEFDLGWFSQWGWLDDSWRRLGCMFGDFRWFVLRGSQIVGSERSCCCRTYICARKSWR